MPILRASTVILMNSSSLKPLQMIGVSSAVGQGQHGQQFRLGAGLQAEVKRLAEVENLLDDVPLLIDLDRIDAAVLALVVVFADGGLEGVVRSRRRDGGGCR